MNSKTCREMRRQIDELDPGQEPNKHISAHLANCPACAAFRHERSELRSLVGSLEPVVAPADFDMRLRARIAASRTPEQPFFARLIGVPAIAMAAVVVLAVGVTVLISQRNSNSPVNTTAEKQTPVAPTGNDVATATPVQSASDSTGVMVATSGNEPPVDKVQSSPGKKIRAVRTGGSRDYSFAAAQVVKQGDGDPFVNAPSKAVEVSLEDDQGTKRKLSLPPVSFGSQSLVNNRVPVSYSQTSRIW
jgi:hypothetical protein